MPPKKLESPAPIASRGFEVVAATDLASEATDCVRVAPDACLSLERLLLVFSVLLPLDSVKSHALFVVSYPMS